MHSLICKQQQMSTMSSGRGIACCGGGGNACACLSGLSFAEGLLVPACPAATCGFDPSSSRPGLPWPGAPGRLLHGAARSADHGTTGWLTQQQHHDHTLHGQLHQASSVNRSEGPLAHAHWQPGQQRPPSLLASLVLTLPAPLRTQRRLACEA
jgi:hypothetical protein